MDGAVAAAGQNGVAALADGLFNMSRDTPRRGAFKDLGRDTRRSEHGQRTLNGRRPPRRVLSGNRVIDQRNTLH